MILLSEAIKFDDVQLPQLHSSSKGGIILACVLLIIGSLASTIENNMVTEIGIACAAIAVVTLFGTLAQQRNVTNTSPLLLEKYLEQILALEVIRTQESLQSLLEPPLRHDWPSRYGEIDLSVHDLPHSSSQTEWWYFNTHITGAEGRPLSLFVCFFRIMQSSHGSNRSYSHALTWAVSDVQNQRYYSDVALQSDAPVAMLKALEDGSLMKDPILKRALKEILEKGNVPLPDRLFKRDPKVGSGKFLDLDFESSSLHKNSDGEYLLSAKHPSLPCSFDLVFAPKKKAVRHGDNGVVKGKEGDDMFYYCIPRCDVKGTIVVPKVHKRGGRVSEDNFDSISIAKGQGWYDHEFGGKPESGWETDRESVSESKGVAEKLTKQHMVRYAWNWVAAQMDDNTEVTAAVLVNPADGSVMELKAIVVDSLGNRSQYDDKDGVQFNILDPKKVFGSVRTFLSYPTEYHLVVPGAGIDVTITATFGDQEFMTLIAKPAFWEGRCDVIGSHTGLAYVERNGFNGESTIKDFFKNVGKKVRKSVKAMYPLVPTYEEGVELIATKGTEHYMKGVPLDVLGQTLIAPVRLIADRGGKSWRSYGALACVDCVGGDSRDFVDWVAMPEFLHVGSLIVDDIQDKSETRRGGAAAHHQYGEPLCINAGTAAYFQCEQMLKAPGLSAEDLNKCYGLYFAALRGGHAGQALDIHGLDYMMDSVVESGDAELLEERLLAIHMLKTAVPAGTLARMGALVGKGTEEQIEAMGRYFESIGVAFQIMDDVLNLRGLYSKESDKLKVGTALKTVGEDITDGKVTMPVCKAMQMLKTSEERQDLWNIVRSKPEDQHVVNKVIAQLEELGAIEACVVQAEVEVNLAWANLDRVIPDSFAKMMLRSFGWFVIERCA